MLSLIATLNRHTCEAYRIGGVDGGEQKRGQGWRGLEERREGNLQLGCKMNKYK